MSQIHLEPRRGKGFVLALDLGSSCGFSSYREDGHVATGMVDLKNGQDRETHGRMFLRLRYMLGRYIEQMVDGPPPKPGDKRLHGAIAIENVQFQAKNGLETVQFWAALWGNVESFGELYGLPRFLYPTTTIKKAITGHGDAPKNAARLAKFNASRIERGVKPYDGLTVEDACREWGVTETDDNALDSFAVLKAHLDAENNGSLPR